jgi:hypothetical protein
MFTIQALNKVANASRKIIILEVVEMKEGFNIVDLKGIYPLLKSMLA